MYYLVGQILQKSVFLEHLIFLDFFTHKKMDMP